MRIYTINQDGAGNYEIEAVNEESAIREIAEAIVDATEEWETQFATDDKDEAIEKAAATLIVVHDRETLGFTQIQMDTARIKKIKKFKLFNELRGHVIYGYDLADAIIRKSTFQKPDKFSLGIKVSDGEKIRVAKIIGYEDTSNSTRDGKPYISCVCELDDDTKSIIAIDAEEITTSIG